MNLPPKRSTVYRENYFKLRAQGYDVIPLSAGKDRPMKGWPDMPNSREDIEKWSGRTAAVRLFGGDVFAIDLDVTDDALITAQLVMLETRWPAFMTACLRRHSGAVKLMLIGRCRGGVALRRTNHWMAGADKHMVEIFGGGCHRYIAVHGKHSSETDREYGYYGRSILETPCAELPEFPVDDVDELFTALEDILRDAGLSEVKAGRVDATTPQTVYDLRPEQMFQLSDGTWLPLSELAKLVQPDKKEEGFATIWHPEADSPDRVKCNWSPADGLCLYDTRTTISHRMEDRASVDGKRPGAVRPDLTKLDALLAALPERDRTARDPGIDAMRKKLAEHDAVTRMGSGPVTAAALTDPNEPKWLERTKTGMPRASLMNARAAIQAKGIVCRKNMFHGGITIQHDANSSGDYVGVLTDEHEVALRVWLAKQKWKVDFLEVHTKTAIESLAYENRHNPVVEMLDAAEADWDRVPRLDRLAVDILHAEDNELHRAIMRKTLIAMVARARTPGCKYDNITVLVGPQDLAKSLFWELLAGKENFSRTNLLGKYIDDRKVMEHLERIWVHENAELAGMSKADAERVKSFVSDDEDHARVAWGRRLKQQKRHSIEVGTTSRPKYLSAPDGNRRFWSVTITGKIDFERLKRERRALLGEAAHWQSQGESLRLPEHIEVAARDDQEERREQSNVEIHLEDFLVPGGVDNIIEDYDGAPWVSATDLLKRLEGRAGVGPTQSTARNIADAMRSLGWDHCRRRLGNGVRKPGYVLRRRPGGLDK